VSAYLLTEIFQLIFQQLEMDSFWINYGGIINGLISIFVTYIIFSWFRSILFDPKFPAIRGNNLLLRYNLIIVLLTFLISLSYSFLIASQFGILQYKLGGINAFAGFFLATLIISLVINVLINIAIHKRFDVKLRKELTSSK